ncbi:RsmD family RNA methyltransferase [bacterium]|nr:RsmD family RNA methyltransferase [bacterium]
MHDGLRITGGEHRGRKLFSPPKNTIRPASDMIRQAVFNMLGSDILGVDFYDVFAGTGVVGLEAISRGARRAIFVENSRKQIQLIERNTKHVGVWDQADVRMADAFLWGRHFKANGGPTIVFIGPPYELFAEKETEKTLGLVERVQNALRPGDLLVFQFARQVSTDRLPRQEGWYRLRQYGKSQVGLWSIPDPDAPKAASDDGIDDGIDERSIDNETDEGSTDDESANP